MKFKGLKVGDELFMVEQRQRFSTGQRMSMQKVTKVGRQYGYIYNGWTELKFCLKTGESVHPRDSNARHNGYGFDVFGSEEEYRALSHAKDEHARLQKRLIGTWDRLVKLPPETVQKIHAILDEMPKAEQ